VDERAERPLAPIALATIEGGGFHGVCVIQLIRSTSNALPWANDAL
jgi:hypothetical protein